MRRAIAFLAVVLAACTFPDVEYADGGATGSTTSADSGTGPCPAPPTCADDATTCGKAAVNKHKSCLNQCKPTKPTCPDECDQDLASARSVCAAACDSCAASMCGASTTNCTGLVGL